MPCVLMRLTDREPMVQRERYSRGISIQQLKRDILWNIELLLNSRSHPSRAELRSDAEVCNSVLGMGLEDFCGVSHGREERERLRREILQQLRNFEPRINPDSLSVSLIDMEANSGSVVELEIHGRIEVAPLSEELLFRSRLDLETGTASVDMSSALRPSGTR